MRSALDLAMALILSTAFLFGNGYVLKKVHNYIKQEAAKQVSKGLSSSEKLANRLTNQTLPF